MNKQQFTPLSCLTWIIAVFSLSGIQCQQESRNPGWVDAANGKIFADRPIPDPLECGKEYIIVVTASEELRPMSEPCATFDMSHLYDEAGRQMRSRLDAMNCPDQCSRLNAYVTRQKFTCNGSNAEVQLRATVQCIAEGDTPIEGLPTPTTFMAPQNDSLLGANLTSPHNEWVESLFDNAYGEFGARGNTRCPTTLRFTVDYWEPVPDCASFNDYGPYIDKAYHMANAYWANATCVDPCIKQAPLTQVEIQECLTGGNDNFVHVGVNLYVECKK